MDKRHGFHLFALLLLAPPKELQRKHAAVPLGACTQTKMPDSPMRLDRQLPHHAAKAEGPHLRQVSCLTTGFFCRQKWQVTQPQPEWGAWTWVQSTLLSGRFSYSRVGGYQKST